MSSILPLGFPSKNSESLLTECIKFVQLYHSKYPICSAKIGIGSSLYILNSLGVFPSTLYLFHPSLFSSPKYELYSGLSNFLYFGSSLGECVGSVFQIVSIHTQLEDSLERQSIKLHKDPFLNDFQRKLSSLLPNRFLQLHLLTSICLIGIECLIASKRGYFIIPYSLFDSMDSTFKWIWSFKLSSQKVELGGIQMHPWLLTLLYFIMRGSYGWSSCIKGFATALIVCEIMNLRNAQDESFVGILKKLLNKLRN